MQEATGTAAPGQVVRMRLRVLLTGLTFFASALILAWGPVAVQAHSVNPWKPCTIKGTGGSDALVGTNRADVLCGFGGNDTLVGLGGNDILRGGPGADILDGGAGSDVLMGQGGRDNLRAYDGTHDHLNGGPGSDHARRDRTLDRVTSVENMS
jgi:Ca2+-binding RTX toxin-like protein